MKTMRGGFVALEVEYDFTAEQEAISEILNSGYLSPETRDFGGGAFGSTVNAMREPKAQRMARLYRPLAKVKHAKRIEVRAEVPFQRGKSRIDFKSSPRIVFSDWKKEDRRLPVEVVWDELAAIFRAKKLAAA